MVGRDSTQSNADVAFPTERGQTLAEWVTSAREATGWNQKQLEMYSGLARGTVGRIERDRDFRVSKDLLQWISELTGQAVPEAVMAQGTDRRFRSKSIQRAQAAFRSGRPVGEAPAVLKAFDRNRIADEIMDLVVRLNEPWEVDDVEAWLRENKDKLNAQERARLVMALVG